MLTLVIFFIALILDGIISLNIPTTSYFQPLLTLTCILILYNQFKNKNKRYLTIIAIIGLIYDLLYTNLLFFHAIIFYLLGIFIIYLNKNYKQNILTIIIFLVIIITLYEGMTQFFLFIFRIVPFSFSKLTYKIIHSLIINIIFIIQIYFLQKGIKPKHKA